VRWNNPIAYPFAAMPEKESKAEIAARKKRQAEAAREAERLREERKIAVRCADDLLMSQLTPEQRDQYRKDKKFIVNVRGRRYEFNCNRQHQNITELAANGNRIREYCVYQTGRCPMPDNHLAQKLLLECDPEQFERKANVFDLNCMN
jgi:hypothetical protein